MFSRPHGEIEMATVSRIISCGFTEHCEGEAGGQGGFKMAWEYKLFNFVLFPDRIRETERELNRLGQEGWEAVSAWREDRSLVGSCVLFKRPTEAVRRGLPP
jgi:hypothetical protein